MPGLVLKPRKGILWVDGTYHGVRVRRSTGERERHKAEVVLRKVMEDIHAEKVLGRKPRATLGEAVALYEASREWRRQYASVLRRLLNAVERCGMGNLACEEFDGDALRAIVRAAFPRGAAWGGVADGVGKDRSRVVTEASVKRGVVSPLKAALRLAAAEWGERRGCREPVFPRLSEGLPRQLWLRPAQALGLETALAALRDPVALAAFVVGVCEGPRSSELCRVRWGDVDLPGGRITLTITKRIGAPLRHEIHDLRPRTVSALGSLVSRRPLPPAPDDFVFADAPGAAGRGDEAAFNRWFNDRLSAAAGVVAAAGVALGFVPTAHVLRHTAATWHYAVCRDVKAVKDRAGWSTLRMADQYAKSAPHGMADEVRAHWGGDVA